MCRFFFGALLIALVASCQQNASRSGSADAQVGDGGVDGVVLFLPAGCPPDAGNELGIGKPCTYGGSQCASPLLCTCGNFGFTLPVNMPCFCTNAKPGPSCPTNVVCGSNATCCSIAGLLYGCVPNVCLTDNQCTLLQ
jgi:hypothetical protein